MKLGVALIVWNGSTFLRACLDSLLAQVRRPDALYLVDNQSTDRSLDIINAYTPAFKGYGIQYSVFNNPENRGFTLAANQVLQVLNELCDVAVLLNQDVALDISCLKAIENVFHAHEDAGAVGCKIFYPDWRTIQHAGGFLERPRLLGRHRGIGEADGPAYQVAYEPEYVTGAAIGLRTQALQQVGMFDEVFSPGYYEEVDLCLRLHAHGWRTIFAPDATLVHHESGSFRERPDYHVIVHRNRLIFASFWLQTVDEWHLFEQAEVAYLSETKDLAALQTLSSAYAKALTILALQRPPRACPHALPACVRIFEAAMRQTRRITLPG